MIVAFVSAINMLLGLAFSSCLIASLPKVRTGGRAAACTRPLTSLRPQHRLQSIEEGPLIGHRRKRKRKQVAGGSIAGGSVGGSTLGGSTAGDSAPPAPSSLQGDAEPTKV